MCRNCLPLRGGRCENADVNVTDGDDGDDTEIVDMVVDSVRSQCVNADLNMYQATLEMVMVVVVK